MTKNFKPDEVIGMIQKKVQLKRDLKELKSAGEDRKAELLTMKIRLLYFIKKHIMSYVV